MHFQAHGIFEVSVENNWLIVDATGPFNEELLQSYSHSIESCVSKLEASPWQQIIVLHQQSLFTPEAESLLSKTVKNRKTRGLKASAVVLLNVEGGALIQQQLSRVYKGANLPHAFFSNQEAAKSWLSSSDF